MIPLALDPSQHIQISNINLITSASKLTNHYNLLLTILITSYFTHPAAESTPLTSFNLIYSMSMKSHSRILAAFVLALLLILSSESNAAHAARFLISKEYPSAKTSTSQTLNGLHANQKKPYKKVDSSFRRIPPSRWNPIQNKFKPP
ncbi:uncharacterized protein LOC132055260 [Lycium ferocissimum]|uniref:uncharacterized protein LOC132055260 n=1 Tax=Lycium ferocissimum TaxID=112874 RepID=UPI0028152CA8|nr:uncharacterized protein LOC132055260 [Lycium ferocissimum]